MLKPNMTVYQVFVRNYSKKGTFKALEKDLPRIRRLGVDIIYLMPIHMIGNVSRKGNYGSPYAIKDYYSISPDLGTLEDFASLVKAIHRSKMKVVMDMVFNHTSPDSVLTKEHPDFFYYNKKGQRCNRVGDWSDIVDLDTSKKETQDYLLKVLKYWRNFEIDGFRFDVAPLISMDFFKRARKALGKKVIFIAENIDENFISYLNKQGIKPTADKDLFPTFDAIYNYHWFGDFMNYIKKGDYQTMISKIKEQDKRLPKSAIVMNCMDNHDQERIAQKLSRTPAKFEEVVNFMFFLKGWGFVYMGDEYGIDHKPDLFEKDDVNWALKDPFATSLFANAIKEKSSEFNGKVVRQDFIYLEDGRVAVKLYSNKGATKVRVFDFRR